MKNSTKQALLKALDAVDRPLTMYAWAQAAELSRMTVRRCLPELKSEGFIRVSAGPHGPVYSLTKNSRIPDEKRSLFNDHATARINPISKETVLELISLLQKAPVVGVALHSQQLPQTLVSVFESALTIQDGGTVTQESLNTYRTNLDVYRQTILKASNLVDSVLSTPELWDPERLGAFLSYEISPKQLINMKNQAEWNVDKAIKAISALQPVTKDNSE